MFRLLPHSENATKCIESLNVDFSVKEDGCFQIVYNVKYDADCLYLPQIAGPKRGDNLWETTCFEAFIIKAESEDYLEFNFSPSLMWAAYHFEGYRQGMADICLPHDPSIQTDSSLGNFRLEALLTLPENWKGCALEIGLSAILHEKDGGKSYWALRHSKGKPDFHHKDCFAMQLAAVIQP